MQKTAENRKENGPKRKGPNIRLCWKVILGAALLLAAALFFPSSSLGFWGTEKDPLCASMEEDPCYADGVFEIYNARDYLRFAGYLNRARKEEPDNEMATAVDAKLMADLNMQEDKRYRLKNHPYIRQSILNYSGTFDGNGHTITWFADAGNGMFVCIERQGEVHSLTFEAPSLVWKMDEYGVGMLCMVNYGTVRNCETRGRVEGTDCYTGGIAGINRGFIENCVNRAEVVVKGLGDYGAGGIAGLSKCDVLDGESREEPIVPEIRNCVNYGKILGAWEAGGICAYNDCANIYECGNEGEVSVQYQKGYIYPEEPGWYERAMAGGICGRMGANSLENCYNKGTVSILEDGVEDTYAIAGNTLFWIHTVSGCVSLKGTAKGSMRHESVAELDPEELERWITDHESVSCDGNNWEFDLEEAKEKLPLIPLGITESELTAGREDICLCEEFCLLGAPGSSVRLVSPYALCMEQDAKKESEEAPSRLQVWLLRIPDDLTDIEEYLDAYGNFVKDTGHEVWLGIEGAHWLHPGQSYKDDVHIRTIVSEKSRQPELWLIHYRDDMLARAAVGNGNEMIDNVVALPIKYSEENGYQAEWLMVFTNKGNNDRPSLYDVEKILENFTWLPCERRVESGDCLYALAEEYTEDGNRYPELLAVNELEHPDRLTPGQVLKIPGEWLVCGLSDR